MANPSSTSSSDIPSLPGGFPWALAGAMLILLAVEIAIRLAPPEQFIPYDGGLGEHLAIASFLSAIGPADVAFVGSSMTRDGIAPPLVRAQLEPAVGRPVYVANYSASSLVIDETNAIVNYMIRQKATPRLLLCEICPQQLRPSTSFRMGTTAIFWDIEDLIRNLVQNGKASTRALPMFIRRQAGQGWLTLRYRERLRQWSQQLLRLTDKPMVPMLGDYPENWDARTTTSLADPARRDSLVQRWLQRNLRGGRYPKIDPKLVVRLEQTLQLCRQHQIPLVLYEMPLSPALRAKMPPDVYKEFYALVGELAGVYAVPFYRVADLDLSIGDEHFSDVVHMNRRGATLLTHALTQKAILPRLAPQTRADLSTSNSSH